MMREIILFSLLVLLGNSTFAQENNLLLVSNKSLVSIHGGESFTGSGFIIGASADSLYIVTASHVVAQVADNETKLQAGLLLQNGFLPAKILFDGKEKLDFAVLSVKKPIGFKWSRLGVNEKPSVEKPVGYVCLRYPRAVRPAKIERYLFHIYDDFYDFDMPEIKGGDSGGALFSLDEVPKIIGMIIDDSGDDEKAVAIQIGAIKKIILKNLPGKWQL